MIRRNEFDFEAHSQVEGTRTLLHQSNAHLSRDKKKELREERVMAPFCGGKTSDVPITPRAQFIYQWQWLVKSGEQLIVILSADVWWERRFPRGETRTATCRMQDMGEGRRPPGSETPSLSVLLSSLYTDQTREEWSADGGAPLNPKELCLDSRWTPTTITNRWIHPRPMIKCLLIRFICDFHLNTT